MRIEMNLSAAKENKAKAPASINTFFILCLFILFVIVLE